MAVKAQWPAGQVTRATTDPFEGIEEGRDHKEQDPYERLKLLIDAETALLNREITCPVRDRDDTSCCACPKRGQIPRLRALCDVGTEQERIVTALSCEKLFEAT